MKKSVFVAVVCLLAVALTGSAEQIKVDGTQAKVLGYGLEFDTAKQGKASVAVGAEVIYLNKDLTSASFKKDAEHSVKYDVHYSCVPCKTHKRVPGRCKCGKALTPSFKHGDTWHTIGYRGGRLTIDGAPTVQKSQCACGCDCTHPCTPEACAACPKCKECPTCKAGCGQNNRCACGCDCAHPCTPEACAACPKCKECPTCKAGCASRGEIKQSKCATCPKARKCRKAKKDGKPGKCGCGCKKAPKADSPRGGN
ncbi:MAG: hypothetical protein OZSIB_2040 [Candidatus Ozemobacter sibiricus]|uniref:Uncharacterized protein n=1 Tax=Candidatus Ozemobacter sibiricus TaxID=2268124 RepID=A0A367ZKK1_9BACT|nr:MAG: hypothetical protein OZSIB_2040 [Candidatus Ozemobacter sibiricus]